MTRKANKDRDCVTAGECRPGHKSNKSTREWCKGKVGVEHQWAWVDDSQIPNKRGAHFWGTAAVTRESVICLTCGKQSYASRDRCVCCHAVVHAYGEDKAVKLGAVEQKKWRQ